MAKSDHGATDPKNTELLNLANLAGSYLQAKKVRDLVSSEIRRHSKEIEHIEDRAAAIEKQLREKMEDIEKIEPQVIKFQRQLAEAQVEMRALEEENAKLEDYEHDLEEKRLRLPALATQVSRLHEEVQNETLRAQALQSSFHEAVSRKKGIEQEVESIAARLSRLEQELPIMQNTRDIIAGQMPSHFDPEVFQNLQGDLEMNFDSYVSEVRDKVSALENEISALRKQVDEEDREKETSLLREKSLRLAVEGLKAYAAIDEARESIAQEIAVAEEEQVRLGSEIDAKKRELEELESGIIALDKEFEFNREHERELLERLKYLDSRARELDGIDNLSDELERLRTQTTKLDLDLEVSSNFCRIMNRIQDDAGSMNASLGMAIAEHKEVFEKIERVMHSLEGK